MAAYDSPDEALAGISVPLFGLPAGDDRARWVKSWSSSERWIVLAHGAAGARDRVDVGVMRRTHSVVTGPPPKVGDHRIGIHHTLATQLFLGRHEPPASATSDEAIRKWARDMNERARRARWTTDTFRVEGEHVPAFRTDELGHWIAFAEIDDVWVYAHSYGPSIESVELVRISDPGPYAAGTPE